MALPRREFLYGLGTSLGTLALSDLQAANEPAISPLTPKLPRHEPKAKAVIMLFMEGGPSHIDTFDPKQKLNDLHLKESNRTEGLATEKRFYVGSPFKSRKVGESGIDMSDQWQFLAKTEIADELCVYRGCQAESLNHPEAVLHMNTGSRLGDNSGLGAWATYGLGTENQNLPGYVVMTEPALPQAGPQNWTNGFLPDYLQGTRLRSEGSPVLDLKPSSYKTRERQPKMLDQVAMVDPAAGIIDIESEPQYLRDAYGLDRKETAAFGRQCMMARRLVEQGVRFVQIFSGGWDSHDYLEKGHSSRIASVDQPIAALIMDLKNRGMLEDTLVVWTGEFGRTPDNHCRGGVASLGRDHNAEAMNMWFAGGGTRKGTIVGATDEIGGKAVEVVHPIRDVHATMMHLLGLDDNKLTYFHDGQQKQLSHFGGELIPELIA